MTSTTEKKVLVTVLLLSKLKTQPKPIEVPLPTVYSNSATSAGGHQPVPPYKFGSEEKPGAYAPNFSGFYGSGASQIGGGRASGPLGGLDGYGGGFIGPVGGVNGMIVGVNQGQGQGGPLGGLYSTLLGQAGYGEAGYGGGGFFPSGFLTGAY